MMYQQRFYRHNLRHQYSIEIRYKESDLFIVSDVALEKDAVRQIIQRYYLEIDGYAKAHPAFKAALSPLAPDAQAPRIVSDMIRASRQSGIGPFSAVAGALATYVGNELLNVSREILIENGGDIFLKINHDKTIGIYLGDHFSPSTITVNIKKRELPFGICSSSATIGPSLNFGKTDVFTVVGNDAISADTFATAYSNRIQKAADIDRVFKEAHNNPLIDALIVAFDAKLYFWGDIELA